MFIRAKDCTGVVIAHVHCPPQKIPSIMLGVEVHHSLLNPSVVENYRRRERSEAHKKLDEYVLLCRRQKVSCTKVIIEKDDVVRGLEELIAVHAVTKLVVGTRHSMRTKSKTALRLAEIAASSCKIWFTCNGHLVSTREPNTTVLAMPPTPARTSVSSMDSLYEFGRRSKINPWQDASRNDDAVTISGSALPHRTQEPDNENVPSHELGHLPERLVEAMSQLSEGERSRKSLLASVNQADEESTKRQRAGRDKFSIHKIHQNWKTDEQIMNRYPSLDQNGLQQVKACVEIGLRCVEDDWKKRPSIEDIVNKLNGECVPIFDQFKRADAVCIGDLDPNLPSGSKVTMNPSRGTMETPVSSSLGAMGPLLRKVDLLLTPKYPLRRLVKHAIQLLKEDLEDINDALVDQSMMDHPNNTMAKYWMHEVRELSYEIDDAIDTMMLPRTAGNAQSVHGHKVARLKIHRLPNILKPSARIARIKELRTLLWGASERYERYQLDGCASSSRSVFSGSSLRIPVACHVAGDLVGIDVPRNELATWLTDQAEQQLKVKCVVGPAGVGKTALAKQLYRELRGQFESRAFIRVPRKPHMSRLLWGMLSQIQRPNKQNLDAFSVQSMIHNIRKHLQNKRYFIVIDGLWEAQVWDIMNRAFPKGHNCSRIMITCEVNSVAAELCSYQSVNVLELKPLCSQDSEKLFFDRISFSDTQCPDQLKEVSCRILRESGGLPLATITFAGLLASQLDNSDLWYHLQQYFISNLANISPDDMLKGIVNFCYDSLPQYLKTCLLYVTMYPEGCIIRKVDLVKQWIVEGFISATSEGKQRVAENYFDELVNRGMIQPEKIMHIDEVLTCTVHHIVFDLLMHKSREENFITAVDYSQTTTEFCMKAHRLSLHFSRAQYAEKPKVLRKSQVRSLAFFGFIRCMPSAMEFKVLRVLILELWADCIGRRSLDLSRISKLFHLRYLKISSHYILVKLQPPIQGLKLLETLEIDARVSEIDISCLPGLLHLSLQEGTKLPDGIDRIISLQTLQSLDLEKNSEDNIRSLGELINLRDLHITCSTALSDENLKRKLEILAASLGRLANLKSIKLHPGAIGNKTMFVDQPIATLSTPSIFLQRLELLPPICIFSRLPEWIGELKTLRILKIMIGVFLTSDIDILTGLPDLTVLSLFIRQPNLGSVVFSSGALPVLKYFKYTCGTLRLAFEEEALPNLQRLKLCFSICGAEHSSHMISGTEHLSNLKEIAVNIGAAAGAKEYILRAAEFWFKDAIHKHPRLLICLNVKNFGWIEEESRPSGFAHRIIYCLGVLVLVVVVHMLFRY